MAPNSPDDIVADLERRFRDRLESLAETLRAEFHDIKIGFWASPIGSLTDYQGYNLGVEGQWPDAPREQPDNVALEIGVMHLTTAPLLCDACVVWGHPSGTLEADLLPDPVPHSAEALAEVERRLPELFEALKAALKRGKPSDWVGP